MTYNYSVKMQCLCGGSESGKEGREKEWLYGSRKGTEVTGYNQMGLREIMKRRVQYA